MKNKIYKFSTKMLVGLVCLGVLIQPIPVSAMTVVFSASNLMINFTKQPDRTLNYQYVGKSNSNSNSNYLWKPIIPSGGVPKDQATPLDGSSWLPLGINISTKGKNVAAIMQDVASLAKFPGDIVTIDLYWNEAEPVVDGVFDLGKIVALLRGLKNLGLSAFITIKIDNPPNWINSNYLSYNAPGPEIDPNTGLTVQDHTQAWASDRLSYSHTSAKSQVLEFIEELVGSFAVGGDFEDVSAAVAGYVLDTGEGYINSKYNTYIGYEQTSVTAFRAWLQSEYTNINALNTKWGKNHASFNTVEMPIPFKKDSSAGGAYKFVGRDSAAWYDLIKWRESVLSSWSKDIIDKIIAVDREWLQQGDNGHMVSILSRGEEPGDSDWQYSGIDISKIASACKNGSDSLLNFWSIDTTADAVNNVSSQWQLARAQDLTGLPVMVQGIGVKSSLSENVKENLLNREAWELFYGGAIGVIFGNGETVTKNNAQWNSIKSIARIINTLKLNVIDSGFTQKEYSFTDYIAESKSQTKNIAFLSSNAQDSILNRAEGEIAAIYSGLKRLGYQPGFVEGSDFVAGTYNTQGLYKALVLARNQKMTNAELSSLKSETINVHANSDLPGLMDAYGVVRHTKQATGIAWDNWRTDMDTLFGIDANNSGVDSDLEDSTYVDGYESSLSGLNRLTKDVSCVSLSYDGKADMWKYRDQLSNNTGTVLAQFSNSNPALVSKDGKRTISLFSLGDSSGNWSWDNRCDFLGLIYGDNGFGVKPVIGLKNSSSVWMDYRVGPENSILVYLYNYSATTAQTVELSSSLLKDMKISLLTGNKVLTEKSADGVVKDLVVNPQQAVLLFGTTGQDKKEDDSEKEKEKEKKQKEQDQKLQNNQLTVEDDYIYKADPPIIHDGSTTNMVPMLSQATDGTGDVLINYQILDGQGDDCRLAGLQYVLDIGVEKAAASSGLENYTWYNIKEANIKGLGDYFSSDPTIRGEINTLVWDNYKKYVDDTVGSSVRIRLKVTDGVNESGFAVSPPFNIASKWYLAEGCVDDFDELVLISNPNEEPVNVKVTLITSGNNTPIEEKFVIKATTRYTLDVNNILSDSLVSEVSAIVECTDGKGIMVERVMYWSSTADRGSYDIKDSGGHVSMGATTPSEQWYFAEGCTSDSFETWFMLLNPGDEASDIAVNYTEADGRQTKKYITVPAMSRYTIHANDIIPSGQFATHFEVTNSAPVVIDRTMYWNSGETRWIDGHCGHGITEPSKKWYFAEGSTKKQRMANNAVIEDINFAQWLLFYNPGDVAADVTMKFVNENGSIVRKEIEIPSKIRYSVYVNDILDDDSFSTIIDSTEELVVERTMYWGWNGIKWAGGHSGGGVNDPGTTWHLAEGATFNDFSEWLLILNTETTGDDVILTFMNADGTKTQKNIYMDPMSRKTVNINELVDEDTISIKVQSSLDIVVERAMYWGRDGKWKSGHSSPAFR